MKFSFKQISAIVTSALMVSMTAGISAAANYPAPFVSGGVANTAIVYGTGGGVSALDVIQAGNIQNSLQSFTTSNLGVSTGEVTTTGETVSFDTGSTKIFLDAPLNIAKSTLTKSDLPTLLTNTEFSGESSTKVFQTIVIGSGQDGGAVNSGRIIFAKQPTSDDDPVVGLSMGDTTNPLYTSRVTFSKAIDFTSANSKGEEIVLFGQTFTIASETDINKLVLLKDANRADLTDTNPTSTVTIGNAYYMIELVSASNTGATIKVINSAGNSQTKEINEATSKRVNGLDIAVTQAGESNLKSYASIIIGSQKITISDSATVTKGESEDPIDGTFASIIGGTNAATELSIKVFKSDSDNDAILPGNSFVDPVFGSFKIDFAGLSTPLNDTSREDISVESSGDDTMTLTMTDSNSNKKTFDFAHVTDGVYELADSSGDKIYTYEGANLNESSYVVLGNEERGHLLQVTRIYNSSGSPSSDQVKLKDIITGESYDAVFSIGEGQGTLTVDGKQYTVRFTGNGDTGNLRIKYPISDSPNVNPFVLYPTIQTENGAMVKLYEPLKNMNLASWDGNGTSVTSFRIPNGNGYTSIPVTGPSGNVWTIDGNSFVTGTIGNNVTVSVGKLQYRFRSTNQVNKVDIYLVKPGTNSIIDEPAVVTIEDKDDNGEYNVVVIDTDDDGGDVGVKDVYFTSSAYKSSKIRLESNSDLEQQIDWYGVLSTIDTGSSGQSNTVLSIPKSQVFTSLFIGSSDSSVSSDGTSQLGSILIKDSESSSVSSKNLIVVGGSCINSVAASLLGGTKCGDDWSAATGVGSGKFLIQSFAKDSGKVALLVAGYDAADTVNAVTYLRTKTVDTTVGKKYIGTSPTNATLQVA